VMMFTRISDRNSRGTFIKSTATVALADAITVFPIVEEAATNVVEKKVGTFMGHEFVNTRPGVCRGLMQAAGSNLSGTSVIYVKPAAHQNGIMTPEILLKSVAQVLPAGATKDMEAAYLAVVGKNWSKSAEYRKAQAAAAATVAAMPATEINRKEIAEKIRTNNHYSLMSNSNSGDVSVIYFSPSPIQFEYGKWNSLVGSVFITQLSAAQTAASPAALSNATTRPKHQITAVFPRPDAPDAANETYITLQNLFASLIRWNSSLQVSEAHNAALNKAVIAGATIEEIFAHTVASLKEGRQESRIKKFLSAQKAITGLVNMKKIKRETREVAALEAEMEGSSVKWIDAQVQARLPKDNMFKLKSKQMKKGKKAMKAVIGGIAAIRTRLVTLDVVGARNTIADEDFLDIYTNAVRALNLFRVSEAVARTRTIEEERKVLVKYMKKLIKEYKEVVAATFTPGIVAMAKIRKINRAKKNLGSGPVVLQKIDAAVMSATNCAAIVDNAVLKKEIWDTNAEFNNALNLPKMYRQAGAIEVPLAKAQVEATRKLIAGWNTAAVNEAAKSHHFRQEILNLWEEYKKTGQKADGKTEADDEAWLY